MRTKLNKQRKQVKISRINSEQKIKKKTKTSNQTYKYKKNQYKQRVVKNSSSQSSSFARTTIRSCGVLRYICVPSMKSMYINPVQEVI